MTRLRVTLIVLAALTFTGLGLAQLTDAEATATETAETRRVFDAYREDHDANYYAEDAIFIDMTKPTEIIEGREAIRSFLAAFYGGAFGDGRYELHNVVVEGNMAMQESTFYGTHTGPLGDMPATGRTVEFRFMTAYLIEDGEIIWGHLYYDSATLLRQLGVFD